MCLIHHLDPEVGAFITGFNHTFYIEIFLMLLNTLLPF